MYEATASLTRDREDKDKDEDPPAGSDQGLKRRKEAMLLKPSTGLHQMNTEMPQNQGSDLGHTDDQPNVEAASKDDWFKKPERPSTPDHD
ncbi:hypothetical protein Tco_1531793 [Tanacetum coccineum]